ncbi:uncharacterized protein LOC134770628 [Penaeus indicus]|uniref:uncharacterized protein LOC134770628 n=1 Tax=Penaeus indicus TaxID=29960 RepID=UPI00300D12CC
MGTPFEILQLPDIFLSELKIIWPELVLFYGKPRHPQSQGSVVAWIGYNTTDWSIGIKFVQFQKNSSLHAGIRRSPYAAMFGCEAKVVLISSSLPDEVIQRMQCEDGLLAVLTTDQNREEPGPVPSAESAEVHFDMELASPEDDLSPKENITAQRKGAHMSQLPQAEHMVKRSRIDLTADEPLDNAAVPIPLVDKGRCDPRNILGVVLERDQNDMYTIGVKAGVLKAKLSRNQFDLCPQRLLGEDSINRDRVVSLREAVTFESNCGGQGFVKSNCPGPKKCRTNRCKCFKNKVKCNTVETPNSTGSPLRISSEFGVRCSELVFSNGSIPVRR